MVPRAPLVIPIWSPWPFVIQALLWSPGPIRVPEPHCFQQALLWSLGPLRVWALLWSPGPIKVPEPVWCPQAPLLSPFGRLAPLCSTGLLYGTHVVLGPIVSQAL